MSIDGIDERCAYPSSCEVFPTDDVLMNDAIMIIYFGWFGFHNILLGGSLLLVGVFAVLVVVKV